MLAIINEILTFKDSRIRPTTIAKDTEPTERTARDPLGVRPNRRRAIRA